MNQSIMTNTLTLKWKFYHNKIYTNFHDNQIPQNNEYCTCLSAILLDCVVKIDNNYCPQIFLEEWNMQ